MHVLVTETNGFIGSHLSDHLVADRQEVVGFDDLSDGSCANLERAKCIRFVHGDLWAEGTVAEAARGCPVIFHLGAKRSVTRSIEEPGLFRDVNVRGALPARLRDVGRDPAGPRANRRTLPDGGPRKEKVG
jgi:nucleoside-diphosphate-sugar epimerase